MALIDFLYRFVDGKVTLETYSKEMEENLSYKILAAEASINLIVKTLSRAEFQTFDSGKEVKNINYYILNVEANKNKSASLFWREVIRKLLEDGEVLILLQDDQLFSADSFDRKEYAFKENIYSDITIGNYELRETREESQVIYLRDDNTKISAAINGLYKNYSKLISSSVKGYTGSKSRKGILDIPTSYSKTLKDGESLQEHIKALLGPFMDAEKDAVFPQTNGLKYEEIDKAKGSKSNDSGRETKNFIDDVFDFIAIGFGVPPSLLKGDTVDTKDALNNFLTFCINPLAKLITDEINRKMYGKKLYLKNTYAKLDTTTIKAVDVRDIANSLELLTRTGSNTIDDNLRALGREPIGGDIGGSRYVTKNLELIDHVLENGKTGGDG
jgi:HK97 family phage portal protein